MYIEILSLLAVFSALVFSIRVKKNNNQLLEDLPFILWVTNSNKNIIYKNKMCKSINQDLVQAMNNYFKENTATKKIKKIQNESSYAIVEFHKIDLKHKKKIFIGIDNTEANQIQANHENISRLLEMSETAIAIYNSERQLIFSNNAFARLWNLKKKWLESSPKYEILLEALRIERKIPEQSDFTLFKKSQLELFSKLSEATNTKWILPDSRTIKISALPDSNGGILFSYEDITEQLKLERTNNAKINIYKEILDNINEGISMFAENGKLKICNKNFQKLWDLEEAMINSEPKINDLMSSAKKMFIGENWIATMNKMNVQINKRIKTIFRVELADKKIIDIHATPMQGGNTLFTYAHSTENCLLEKTLRDKNTAVRSVNKLKAEFIANAAYILKSPLTSVIGYAEILKKHYSNGQKEHLKCLTIIISESLKLKNQIDSIIDLSALEIGNIRTNISTIQINKIIEKSIKQILLQAEAKKIKIKTMKKEKIFLDCDEKMIQEAITQILNISLEDSECEVLIDFEINKANVMIQIIHSNKEFKPLMQNIEFSILLSKKLISLHGGDVNIICNDSIYEGANLSLPTTMKKK